MDLRYSRLQRAGALALASALALTPAARAAEPRTSKREAELEERVRRLERIIEQQHQQPQAPTRGPAGTPTAEPATTLEPSQVEAIVDEKLRKQKVLAGWKDGFFLESSNGDFKLKLRGYVQADARAFPLESGDTGTDSFTMRRVRPIFEGTVYKHFDFRIMPDFGGSSPTLQDAYLDIRYFAPWVNLRAGKFKAPLSLERLQSATDLLFVERSIANSLAPNRDVGVMAYGDLFDGVLGWQLMGSNGNVDGGSNDQDVTSDKEITARVFGHPFKPTHIAALEGLGVGVAGSWGNQKRGESLADLRYRTSGRSAFFRYATNADVSVVADGDRIRFSPQAYWYWGPVGFMGEYLLSKQGVLRTDADAGTTTEAEFLNTGWFAQASWVLTGENNSYKGVTPINPFDPRNGRWGAFEVALRGGGLEVDEDAFALGFAREDQSSRETWQYGVGVNWYLNRAIKIMADWERTEFENQIAFSNGVTRDHEDVFLARFQVSF